MLKNIIVAAVIMLTSACAGTVPAEYTAQSYIKVGDGQMRMGDFEYIPAISGKLKGNQIQNTALGSIYMSSDVSEIVKRATALEFERSGLTVIDSANKEVRAEIYEFKANDLGWNVDWTFKVKYGLYETSSGKELLINTYDADKKRTGKFGLPSDYAPSINQMIRNALEKFMRDVRDLGVFTSAQ